MEIVFEGEPKGKGRPRFTRTGHAYTPSRTRDYEDLIAARALEAMEGRHPIPKGVPVRVTIVAIFGVPVSWPKKRRTAALNGIVYEDDSQIVQTTTEKTYGPEPMVRIFIEELKEEAR